MKNDIISMKINNMTYSGENNSLILETEIDGKNTSVAISMSDAIKISEEVEAYQIKEHIKFHLANDYKPAVMNDTELIDDIINEYIYRKGDTDFEQSELVGISIDEYEECLDKYRYDVVDLYLIETYSRDVINNTNLVKSIADDYVAIMANNDNIDIDELTEDNIFDYLHEDIGAVRKIIYDAAKKYKKQLKSYSK